MSFPVWEYLVVPVIVPVLEPYSVLQDKLDEYGANGWELVWHDRPLQILQGAVAVQHRCIFKRVVRS